MNSKKMAVLWLCLVMIFSFVIIIVEMPRPVKAGTIWVDDDYVVEDPTHKMTIQAAVNNATPGDTVFVYNGTYYEHVVVDKTINLIGENRDTTIINGGGFDGVAVLQVNAYGVEIKGFTATGAGNVWGDAGIELNNVGNCNVSDNTVSNNECLGIYLYYSSGNIISGNNGSNNDPDIGLEYSDGNTITDNEGVIYFGSSGGNTITDNEGSIQLYPGSNGNTVTSNRGFIYLNSASDNDINGNTALNTWDGIWLEDSNGNTVVGNTLSNNDYGVILISSDGNTISGNIASNNEIGIYLSNSFNNMVYHNNILSNTNQAYDDTNNANQWDNGYPSGGNFWSDYTGDDIFSGPNQDISGNDGIGDVNYSIDSDSSDNYPLMSSIGNNIFLYQGWNLISIPFIQSDTDVSSVLSSISGNLNAVQWYNTNDYDDPWKHNSTKKPSHLNDLDSIDHTMGFWIHITDPGGTTLVVFGDFLTSTQNIDLNPGWNLVGYPSTTDKIRITALNNVLFDTDVDAIWTHNATTQTWKEITSSDNFEVGRGYWIHSKVTKTWIVPL